MFEIRVAMENIQNLQQQSGLFTLIYLIGFVLPLAVLLLAVASAVTEKRPRSGNEKILGSARDSDRPGGSAY